MASAIANSNANVAEVFGLSGVDITSVKPTDLTGTGGDAGSTETLYAVIIAALCQQAMANGQDPATVLSNVQSLGTDLADGRIDETANANLLNTLQQSADDFLDGSQNNSGVSGGTIVIAVSTTPTTDGGGGSSGGGSSGDVEGCNNPEATNYDPTVTVYVPGSCIWPTTPTPTPGVAPVTTGALVQFAALSVEWVGTAKIDRAGTGYCVAAPQGSPRPTAAEVKGFSHPLHAGGGTVAMSANTTASCVVTGLSASTTYDFYFVAEDSVGTLQSDANVFGPVPGTTGAVAASDLTGVTFDSKTKTSLSYAVTATTGGTLYCAAVPSASAAPSTGRIRVGTGGTLAGVGGSVALDGTCTVTGLTQGTSYKVYFLKDNGNGSFATAAVGTTLGATSTAVSTATQPISQSMTMRWITSGHFEIEMIANGAATGYLAAVPAGSAAPSQAQIMAGTGGGIDGANNRALVANTAKTFGVGPGVPPFRYNLGTARDIYLLMKTTNPEASIYETYSTTPVFINATTAVTVQISPFTVNTINATSIVVDATADQPGATGFCVAVAAGGAAPTAAQVIARSGGGILAGGGTVNLNWMGPYSPSTGQCTIGSLTSATSYDLYFSAQDEWNGSMSTTVKIANVTTN